MFLELTHCCDGRFDAKTLESLHFCWRKVDALRDTRGAKLDWWVYDCVVKGLELSFYFVFLLHQYGTPHSLKHLIARCGILQFLIERFIAAGPAVQSTLEEVNGNTGNSILNQKLQKSMVLHYNLYPIVANLQHLTLLPLVKY